jgi:hypothetical protein
MWTIFQHEPILDQELGAVKNILTFEANHFPTSRQSQREGAVNK